MLKFKATAVPAASQFISWKERNQAISQFRFTTRPVYYRPFFARGTSSSRKNPLLLMQVCAVIIHAIHVEKASGNNSCTCCHENQSAPAELFFDQVISDQKNQCCQDCNLSEPAWISQAPENERRRGKNHGSSQQNQAFQR